MVIKKAEFIKSMRQKSDYPELELPEIAVAGRSNSGKSSLINCLANHGSLAKVSGTPGKTRLVNFFRFKAEEEFVLVDLPGYGYARVSKDEKKTWMDMIEGYFAVTKRLKALLALMDIRHEPNDYDKQMLYWAQYYSIPFVIVATKADKIAKSKRIHYIRDILKELNIQAGIPTVAFSSLDKTGREELCAVIGDYIKEQTV